MKTKNIWIMMISIPVLFLGVNQTEAWAKQKESVSIKVSTQTIHVNTRFARVGKTRPVSLSITRKQPGRGCTKVPFVRVVEGNDPLRLNEMAFVKIGSKRKGLCNFTKNIAVYHPFTNQEILSRCTRRGRVTITKNATVSFWKTKPVKTKYVTDGYKQECKMVRENCRPVQPIDRHPGEVRCDKVRRCSQVPYGHQASCSKVCGGRKIKYKRGKQSPDHRFRFIASVVCK